MTLKYPSLYVDTSPKDLDLIILQSQKFIKIYLSKCPLLPIYYIDKHFGSRINGIKSPRVFVIAIILITIKWIEDEYPSNKGIANLFKLSPIELNELEIQILKEIEYRLFVTVEDYELFIRELYDTFNH